MSVLMSFKFITLQQIIPMPQNCFTAVIFISKSTICILFTFLNARVQYMKSNTTPLFKHSITCQTLPNKVFSEPKHNRLKFLGFNWMSWTLRCLRSKPVSIFRRFHHPKPSVAVNTSLLSQLLPLPSPHVSGIWQAFLTKVGHHKNSTTLWKVNVTTPVAPAPS